MTHRVAEVERPLAPVTALAGKAGGQLAREGIQRLAQHLHLLPAGVHELDVLRERLAQRLGHRLGPAIGDETAADFGLDERQDLGDDPARALLIQNSIPVTGGASGSPVINVEGQVVAILSGGTLIEGTRTPSAVLINYAQRADIIGGAVDPASFDLAAARAVWEQSLARFSHHEDQLVAAAELALQAETGTRAAVTDAETAATLDGEGSVKNLLPDSHTDFVFAVAGEELGLLACLGIVGLFAFVVLRGFSRAFKDSSLFVMLAVSGLLTQFGLQALINMGVTVRLLPAKGMTLPLVSYGGSSLVATALAMGMVLALTRERPSAWRVPA